jgi:hypothetical protein
MSSKIKTQSTKQKVVQAIKLHDKLSIPRKNFTLSLILSIFLEIKILKKSRKKY